MTRPAPASRWGRLLAQTLVALALVGCGVPASRYCYLVSDGVVRTVDLGMQVAGDLYRGGHLSETAKDKLIASHGIYREVAKGVVAGCKVLHDDEEKEADELIAKMQAAAQPLLGDLQKIGAQ